MAVIIIIVDLNERSIALNKQMRVAFFTLIGWLIALLRRSGKQELVTRTKNTCSPLSWKGQGKDVISWNIKLEYQIKCILNGCSVSGVECI